MESVYIFQEIDLDRTTPTGLYKIGRTKTETDKRKRQYRAGNSRFLADFYVIKVVNSQAVETELHRRFDCCRLKGYGGGDEWFDFRHVDMDEVTSIMNGYNEHKEPQAYAPPKSTYQQPIYSSSGFELSDLLTSPVAWIIGIFLFFGALHNSPSANLDKQSNSTEEAGWSQHSCINPNGCQGTIDASFTGYEAANLRSAPDQDSKVIATLKNGQKVTVFEQSKGWFKVKLDNGIRGWVANNLIRE